MHRKSTSILWCALAVMILFMSFIVHPASASSHRQTDQPDPNPVETTNFNEYTKTVRGGAQRVEETFSTYLPLTIYQRPSRGIYGTVTFLGQPAAGTQLDLYSGGSVVQSTVVQPDGSYSFLNVPGLTDGSSYSVWTKDNRTDPQYAFYCNGSVITSYIEGAEADGGSFDVANIPLQLPANNAEISLPYTFNWTPRAGVVDDYGISMFAQSASFDLSRLGYVGEYTLQTLPEDFQFGVAYRWHVYSYQYFGPEEDIAICSSYSTRTVTFFPTSADWMGEFLAGQLLPVELQQVFNTTAAQTGQ